MTIITELDLLSQDGTRMTLHNVSLQSLTRLLSGQIPGTRLVLHLPNDVESRAAATTLRSYRGQLTPEQIAALRTRVDSLKMSGRSRNCLGNYGFEYLGQIARRTEDQLLEMKNFGNESLGEIEQLLTDNGGLAFGMADVIDGYLAWLVDITVEQLGDLRAPFHRLIERRSGDVFMPDLSIGQLAALTPREIVDIISDELERGHYRSLTSDELAWVMRTITTGREVLGTLCGLDYGTEEYREIAPFLSHRWP